jgi:hypothetical protein
MGSPSGLSSGGLTTKTHRWLESADFTVAGRLRDGRSAAPVFVASGEVIPDRYASAFGLDSLAASGGTWDS